MCKGYFFFCFSGGSKLLEAKKSTGRYMVSILGLFFENIPLNPDLLCAMSRLDPKTWSHKIGPKCDSPF